MEAKGFKSLFEDYATQAKVHRLHLEDIGIIRYYNEEYGNIYACIRLNFESMFKIKGTFWDSDEEVLQNENIQYGTGRK